LRGRRAGVFVGKVAAVVFLFAGCATTGGASTSTQDPTAIDPADTTTVAPAATAGCADVIAGSIEWSGDTATVSATVRSSDTGWDKYADRWEVRLEDGTVLGERILTHPHETEQPFTRSLPVVSIPADTDSVLIVAHDSVAGWCGAVAEVAVPSAP
jgi:hypothetical protein